MTGIVPVMWTIWGLLVVAVAGLHLYCGRLSRDEDDQVILDDSFDNVKNEQAAIVAKVAKIEPFERTAKWALGVMTVVVIAYYIYDIINQFK
jgi:hypothetical protein